MSGHRSIDRRQLLQGAALVMAGVPLLGACHSDSPDNSAKANTHVALPANIPYRGVRPDLPGTPQGVMDGFLRYPASPVATISEVPGSGGPVHAMVQSYSPIPPPVGRNHYWQELNRRLGVDLEMSITNANSYADKFATTIAGGDLPDLIQVIGQPSRLPELLAAKCQDLTEYLSGDAVKEFPFLGNLPTYSWKPAIYNGGIYGIPLPRGVAGIYIYRRDDIIEAKGLDPDPKSFAEFRKLCQELTEPKQSTWALSTTPLPFIQEMLHVPNGWKNDAGKLINAIEVEETPQALDAAAGLVKEELVHPDSFTAAVTTLKEWFGNGTARLTWDSYPAWPGYYQANVAGPDFRIGAMAVPGFDGGQGVLWKTSGVTSITALKKADPKRVKELLRICNWLTAPFGTAEYVFRKYGIEGVDYTRKNGAPVLTDTGTAETAVDVLYIADAPDVLFAPGLPAVTRAEYAYQKASIPYAIQNPTVGLFSATQAADGAELATAVNQAQLDILQGRKPVSSWTDVVKTWKREGGEKIRGEYEEALQHR